MNVIFNILAGIILILIGYCIKWFENYLRNRNPLSINVGQDFNYTGHGGIRGSLSHIDFRMKINFKNNTKSENNIMISNISLYPQKEIEFFDFEYENGVYSEINSSPIKDFQISPGSKLVYFKFSIRGNNKFGLSDIERHTDIPMIFKIEYSLSPDFKTKTEKIKMEKFFNNLIETVKNRNIF